MEWFSSEDMLGAYYTKRIEGKVVFDKLNIATSEEYEEHLNKYNVISISFNKLPSNFDSYKNYIGLIERILIDDIKELYPEVDFREYFTLSDMLFKTKDKFVFIFDEWDYIFIMMRIACLAARDAYNIEREEVEKGNSASYTFGGVSDSHKIKDFGSLLKEYADFTFHPRRKNDPAIIIELKKDEAPEVALKQIKEKEYFQKFRS